jgi:hypothetical protein
VLRNRVGMGSLLVWCSRRAGIPPGFGRFRGGSESWEAGDGHRRGVQAASNDRRAVQGELARRPAGVAAARTHLPCGVGEGDGFFTVSVWESPEAYNAFAPIFTQAMSEMGFHFGTPEIVPVHHMLQPGVV